MPGPTIISYSMDNIRLWEEELKTLPVISRTDFTGATSNILRKRGELQRKINSANEFQMYLRAGPWRLVQKLLNDIEATFTSFEYGHPAGQSTTTQIALAELKHFHYLISLQANSYPDIIELHRSLYVHLCGLLWSTLNKINEQALIGEIVILLQNTHVDRTDSFIVGENPLSYFYSHYRFPPPNTFIEVGMLNFYLHLIELQNIITDLPRSTFTNKTLTLAQSLLDTIKSDLQNDPSFDMKFFTHVLRETHLLLLNPNNEILRSRYLMLADRARGKPSIASKMVGIGLLLLGCSIIVGALLLGTVIPISPLMFILTFGFVGVFHGCRLFKNGLRSDMSKVMADLTKIMPERSGPIVLQAFQTQPLSFRLSDSR
jgi:hypothetical protein